MTNQLVMFPPLEDWEDEKEIERQFEVAVEYGKKKRKPLLKVKLILVIQ